MDERLFHPDLPELVIDILGEAYQGSWSDETDGHPVLWFAFSTDFDMGRVQARLRRGLNAIEWQLAVERSTTFVPSSLPLPCSMCIVAPIMPIAADVIYHATRLSRLPDIQRDGLILSTPETSNTNYPNSFGRITGCASPGPQPGGGEWWRREFTKADGEARVVLKVDTRGLVNRGARIYRDLDSSSGINIDRVARIEWSRITVVAPSEDPVTPS